MAGRAHYSSSRPDTIKWFLILGALVAVGLLGYLSLRHSHFFHKDVFLGERYPIRGIDVSKHNGVIDYNKVADAGYSFVFVKATEGATFVDSNFYTNCRKASDAGLIVGAYHFFRSNREGDVQAHNFIKAIKRVELDMPLVVDVEDWGNYNIVSEAEFNSRLRAMVKTLKQEGYKVMIYTNGDGYRKYYKPNFEGEYLWLCKLSDPDSVTTAGHKFQQFSHWGRVAGIKGDVDLNVFMGSEREWDKWLDKVNE